MCVMIWELGDQPPKSRKSEKTKNKIPAGIIGRWNDVFSATYKQELYFWSLMFDPKASALRVRV